MIFASDLSPEQHNEYERQVQAAYDRYHAHYNNETYSQIQVGVVCDIAGHFKATHPPLRDQVLAMPPAHDILNLVTDVALELCGHPDMKGRQSRLLRLIIEEGLTETTVRLIRQYLEQFEDKGSTFSNDFANAARAAVAVGDLLERVRRLIQLTGDIHGSAGNAAYHLARAVHGLVRTMELVLQGETDAAYLREQLNTADCHLADAKQRLSQCIPAFETAIRPYNTLVVSSDGTYPGMVTKVDEHLIQIRWYKWGFNSETFVGLLSPRQFEQQRLSAAECQKRFGGLPPEYH